MGNRLLQSIFIVILLSCEKSVVHAQSNFNLPLTTRSLDSRIKIRETIDTNYLVYSAGIDFLSGALGEYRFKITKIDKNGVLLSSHYYNKLEYLNQLTSSAENGGTLILGNYLTKIDSMGEVKWNRTYKNNNYGSDLKSFIPAPDSGYFLVGNLYPSFVNASNFYILKIDKAGTIQWSKRMDIVQHYESISFARDAGNGRVLLAGKIVNPFTFIEEPLITMMDTTGAVLWTKKIEYLGLDALLEGTISDQNTIVLLGQTNEYGAGGKDIFTLKMDIDGNVLSSSTFGTTQNDFPVSFFLKNNGNILVAGYQSPIGLDLKKCFWAEINASGQVLNAWISNTPQSQGRSIIQTSDQGTLFIQQILVNPIIDGYRMEIIKMEENGKTECPGFSPTPFLTGSFAPLILPGYLILPNATVFTTTIAPVQDSIILPVLPPAVCKDSCKVISYFSADNVQICAGETVHFTNTSTGSLNHYYWYVNNLLADSSFHFTQSFASSGIWKIKLLAADTLCSDSLVRYINVTSNINSDFLMDPKALVVNFFDTSATATGRLWDFGDGRSSSSRHPQHVYDSVGIYQVCLKLFNWCDTVLICKTIDLHDNNNISFHHMYKTSETGQQWGNAITALKDGGYMVTGEDRYWGSSGGKLLMLKTDNKGNLKSTGVVLNGLDIRGFCVKECTDLGYLFGGRYELSGNRWATLLKTNATGGLHWRYNFRVSNSADGIYACNVTSDTGYVFTGYSGSQIFVGKINTGGQKQWLWYYTGGKNARSVVETPDGGFLITGESREGGDIYLLKLDKNGQRIWSKSYNSNNSYDYGRSCIVLKNGHYMITGGTNGFTNGSDIFTLEVDETGAIITAFYYSINGNEGGQTIHQTTSGDFILTGAASNLPLALKISASGAVIWSNAYPGQYGAGGTATLDDGVAFAGYRTESGLEKVSIIKTDKWGNVGCQLSPLTFVSGPAPFSVSNAILDSIPPIAFTESNVFGYSEFFDVEDVLLCYSDICNTLEINSNLRNLSCKGIPDGWAQVDPTGGTAPYMFLWNTGANTKKIENLSAGTYTVTVSDAGNCIHEETFQIGQSEIEASYMIHNPDCQGTPNGSIEATIQSEASLQSVFWDNGTTGPSITGLSAGIYTLMVKDENECEFSDTIELLPATLDINVVSNSIVCMGASDGKASLVITSQIAPPVAVLWSNGATTNAITGLLPGTYTVTVSDGNFCIAVDSVTIPLAIIEVDTLVVPPSCYNLNDGSISIQINNISYPPLNVTWLNDNSHDLVKTGLYSGFYGIYYTDAAGCGSFWPFNLNAPSEIIVQTSSTPDAVGTPAPEGSATASTIGGVPPYTYAWNDPAMQAGMTASLLYAGTYTVTVTDSHQCSVIQTVTVNSTTNSHGIEDMNAMQIYPNPMLGAFNCTVVGANALDWNVKVFNTIGVNVTNVISTHWPRFDQLHLKSAILPAGMYFIQLTQTTTGWIKVIPVVKGEY